MISYLQLFLHCALVIASLVVIKFKSECWTEHVVPNLAAQLVSVALIGKIFGRGLQAFDQPKPEKTVEVLADICVCLLAQACISRRTFHRYSLVLFMYHCSSSLLAFCHLFFEVMLDLNRTQISILLAASRCFWETSLMVLFLTYSLSKVSRNPANICYDITRASLFSKLTFWWIFPLLKTGYKSPLEAEDLGSLNPRNSAFICNFNSQKSLLKSCLKANVSLIATAAMLRLCADLLSCAGALSIQVIIDYVEGKSDESFFGNGFVVAYLLLFAGFFQAICSQLSTHLLTIASLRSKNELLLMIHQKILTTNDPQTGLVTSLITEDVVHFQDLIWNINSLWSIPLKLTAILILVHSKMGWSGFLAVLLATIFVIPVQFFIGKIMSKNNKKILDCLDKRLEASIDALKAMQTLKLEGLEDLIMDKITAHRKQELEALNVDSWMWSLMAILASISTPLAVGLLIGIRVLLFDEPSFSSGNIFTTLALFGQLAVTMSVFPLTVPIYVKGLISKQRIANFLSRDVIWRPCLESDNPDIRLDKAHFTRGIEDSITLRIQGGSLTVISGPSGAGKSSLVRGILGENPLKSGSVSRVNSFVAYHDQQPWLMDTTIRENILFNRPFKEKRYMKVCLSPETFITVQIFYLGHFKISRLLLVLSKN